MFRLFLGAKLDETMKKPHVHLTLVLLEIDTSEKVNIPVVCSVVAWWGPKVSLLLTPNMGWSSMIEIIGSKANFLDPLFESCFSCFIIGFMRLPCSDQFWYDQITNKAPEVSAGLAGSRSEFQPNHCRCPEYTAVFHHCRRSKFHPNHSCWCSHLAVWSRPKSPWHYLRKSHRYPKPVAAVVATFVVPQSCLAEHPQWSPGSWHWAKRTNDSPRVATTEDLSRTLDPQNELELELMNHCIQFSCDVCMCTFHFLPKWAHHWPIGLHTTASRIHCWCWMKSQLHHKLSLLSLVPVGLSERLETLTQTAPRPPRPCSDCVDLGKYLAYLFQL